MLKSYFLLFIALIASSTLAAADTVFNFNFDFPAAGPSGFSDSGSGTLTATFDGANGYYVVNGITGTTSAWGEITGLLPPDTYGGNDNRIYYPNATEVITSDGISFTVAGPGDDGDHRVNVFFVEIPPGCPSENTCVPQVYTENDSAIGYGTFAVTPVPEPASPAGFAVVCGGAVWALRRRKRAAVPA